MKHVKARVQVMLAFALLVCSPLSVLAQLPKGLQDCLPYPTLQEDLRARNRKAGQPETDQPKVVITEVKLDGARQLATEIQEELIASLMEEVYPADSKWTDEVESKIRAAWQDNGYFKAEINVQFELIREDSTQQAVSLYVRVKEGAQYRLKRIQFQSSDPDRELIFPVERLRQQIPLEDGVIFNVERIRQGLKALQDLYAAEGYIDFTSQPLTDADDENREITLRLELDQQKRFYLGGIAILGIDPTSQSRLKWKLNVGQPMNAALLDEFLEDNKDVLPADASRRDLNVERDLSGGLVYVVFDFRRGCPKPDVQ